MVRAGVGRFINRPSKTGQKLYNRFFIYLPVDLCEDERFPFKAGDQVIARIEGDTVIIEKG